MAKHKDPAFLFYVSDFLTGTMFMSNEQVGIYIRLLCSQHQHGGMIDKLSFNSMVGLHEIVRGKFIETENGFYNERLMDEMTKRNKKSNNISKAAFDTWQKRKNTIVQENDTIVLQSYNDTKENGYNRNKIVIRSVNENENIDIDKGGVGEKDKTKPKKVITEQDVIDYFLENGYREDIAKKAFRYYADANWMDSTGKKVKNWKQKMQGVWFKDEHKINNNKDEYTNQIRQHGQGLMLDFLGINQDSSSSGNDLLLRGDTSPSE